jgi:N-acetylglucosaminyldiphosphoundecaprenol N-acetyl-beta-D-mannosaminyltransferase
MTAVVVDRTAMPLRRTDFERPVYCILGLPFDAVTTGQAEQLVLDAAATHRRCFFSTPNLNFLVAALADQPFRMSVLRSDLSLADGMPIIWIARALGVPVVERVAGSTLFERLRARRGGRFSMYFFGGPDGVAARAGEIINAEGGSMVCVGTHSPGFGNVEQLSPPAQIAAISASGAVFLLVALGAQRGQAWIEHNLATLRTPVVSHLGAVVNFVAGNIKRAPPKWGALGLEWLWRIKEEPTLWRRYYRDGVAFLRLLTGKVLPGALAARRARGRIAAAPAPQLAVQRTGGAVTITLAGEWHAGALAPLRQALTGLADDAQAADIALDLGQVTGLDSATIGLLLVLLGHQSIAGRALAVTAVSSAARRALDLACATYLLQPLAPTAAAPFAATPQPIL